MIGYTSTQKKKLFTYQNGSRKAASSLRRGENHHDKPGICYEKEEHNSPIWGSGYLHSLYR